MKRSLLLSLICGICCVTTYANTPTAPSTKTTPQVTAPAIDKVSYAIGASLGKNFKLRNVDIDTTQLMQGLNDAISGKPVKMTDDEIKSTLMSYQTYMMRKTMADFNASKTKNLQAGEAFLAKNAKESGVVSLPSGLQYKIITEGNGAQPTNADTITVDYSGKLLNGTEFDSSAKHGKPMTTPLQYMIPGWVEALKLMKVGSTWEIYVPSKLAYGENGAAPVIGPNETLIFNIHLIDVKKAAPVKASKNATPSEKKM